MDEDVGERQDFANLSILYSSSEPGECLTSSKIVLNNTEPSFLFPVCTCMKRHLPG